MKYLFNSISLRGEVLVHKNSLTPPLFAEVPVPSQESERSCICVLRVLISHISTIFRLDFRTVLRVRYLLFLLFYSQHILTCKRASLHMDPDLPSFEVMPLLLVWLFISALLAIDCTQTCPLLK